MIDSDHAEGYRFSYQLFRRGELVREDELHTTSVTIGRADSNVIVLDDPAIADLHAVVKLGKDYSLVLTDLGSDTGTYLGAARVDMRAELDPETVVRIGPFELQFFVEVFETQPSEEETEAPGPVAFDLDQATKDVVALIFESWDRTDDSGVDDKRSRKVLEVYEVWGDQILSANQYSRENAKVLIGSTSKSQSTYVVPIEDLPVKPAYPLLLSRGRAPYLRFAESQTGLLYLDNKSMSLADAIRDGVAKPVTGQPLYEVPLPADARFVVNVGPLTFVGGSCYPAKRPASAGRMDVDTSFMTLLLVIALLFGGSTLYMMSLPPPPEMDLNQIPDRFAKLIIPKKLEKKEKIEKKEIRTQTKKEKAPKEEKKSTKRDDSKTPKKYNKKAIDKAAMDKKIAERSGLLGELGSGSGSKGLFGEGLGAGVISGVAGLLGTTGSSSITGVQGGSRGLGFGGGGTAGGIGGVGTRGGGGGGGGGGVTVKRKKKKTYADINVAGGNAVVLGALDKAIIDKVIRDHLNAIRYCYQRELVRNPRLSGKVTIKFTIAGNGTVSQSAVKESTMGSVSVEKCVSQRIQQLRFPEPRGGGIVIVSYPFFFKAAG